MTLQNTARWMFLSLILAFLLSWDVRDRGRLGVIPREPDYADSTQWFIRDRGAAADLFYIVSTESVDFPVGDDTCHFADTYNPKMCWGILKEMSAVDSLYNTTFNYFSPYYRQLTMQAWGSDSIVRARLPLAMGDVMRSWDYYLQHLNHGRPFILAGFSQGAYGLLEIMKHMPDTVARRMVAAYAIGYKISQQELDSFPIIRPAQGASDVGVTIGFNSVRSPECAIPIVSEGNVVCINPVNWRTDTVSAPFVLYGRKRNDTLSVHLDPQSHLLIVEGYQDKAVMPIIGRPGNYHHRELKLYYPYIRQNMADRVRAFFTATE